MGSCVQENIDNGRKGRFFHNHIIALFQIHEGDIAQGLIGFAYNLDVLGLDVDVAPKEHGRQSGSYMFGSLGVAEPEGLYIVSGRNFPQDFVQIGQGQGFPVCQNPCKGNGTGEIGGIVQMLERVLQPQKVVIEILVQRGKSFTGIRPAVGLYFGWAVSHKISSGGLGGGID